MAPCTYILKENFVEVKVQSEKILIKLPPSEDIQSSIAASNPRSKNLDEYLKYFFGSKYDEKSFPCKLAKQRLCNQVQLFYDMLLDVEEFDKPTADLKCVLFNFAEKPKEEKFAVESEKCNYASEKPKEQPTGEKQPVNSKPLVRIANTPSEKRGIVCETRKRPVRKCREYALPYSLFEEFEDIPVKEKKRHVEPTYCIECDEFTVDSDCGDHKSEIFNVRDTEVETGIVDRARLTCPKEVSVCRSGIRDAGLGVYSNCLIKRGTMFGPYEGAFRTNVDLSPESRDGDYAWDVGDGLYVDARNEKKSNWMRYVNNGDAHSRTNLRAVRIKKEIFYVVWKDIKPGFELLIWYGDDYADLLGCFDDGEGGDPEELCDAYKCFKCNMLYSCREFLCKHFRRCRGKMIVDEEDLREPILIWQWCSCPKHTSKCVKQDELKYRIKIPAKSVAIQRKEKREINVGVGLLSLQKKVKDDLGKEERKFKCSFCSASFKQKIVLIRHERIHSGEKPYSCEYCDARFSQQSHLINHERIHSGEKPYSCQYCDAKFSRKSYLINHERIHSGEKPFACNYCDAKFAQSGDLKKHERIHTGEKPYECNCCHMKFTRSSNLRVHERRHKELSHE